MINKMPNKSQHLLYFLNENLDQLNQKTATKLVTSINNWIEGPEPELEKFFVEKQDQIPNMISKATESGYYRGVIFSVNQHNQLIQLVNENQLKQNKERLAESWTKSKEQAREFARGFKGTPQKPLLGVVFSKRLTSTDILLDLSFLCDEENNEILQDLINKSGVKPSQSNVETCQNEQEVVVKSQTLSSDDIDEIFAYDADTGRLEAELDNLKDIKDHLEVEGFL